jgi:UPF0755 protein
VAELLEDKGIIGNALFYRLNSLVMGSDDDFAGGTFVVNSDMDSSEINYALRSVVVQADYNTITVSEGFTLKDIAEYLESMEIITGAEFLEACDNYPVENYPFGYDIPQRENRLEGYLFPDTYFVSINADANEIITKMLDGFAAKYTPELAVRADELGLTMDEVINIASIIEGEIRVESERDKCAQVIYNRLADNMPLGMDATVLYVLDKRKESLTESDLAIDSPYNTRLYPGLPYGPICNPGLSCIEAALFPSEGNLMYYVVMNEETGEHFFTSSYDEFLDAKARYNSRF